MTTAGTFNPSAVDVVKALIRPFRQPDEKVPVIDISALIGRFQITQTIDSPAVHFNFSVLDTIGVLENFPLRGEEELEIQIVCHDLQTNLELKLQIYKINEVETTQNNDGVSYKLHAMTQTSYNAALNTVVTAFRNKPASSAAADVFEKYFCKTGIPIVTDKTVLPFGGVRRSLSDNKKRSFTYQPSEGLLRFTIPRYTPSESMYFIAGRSFSRNSPSCSFRFFENFNGYHFATDEFLIKTALDNKQIKNINYQVFTSLDPRDAVSQITQVEELTNTSRVDVSHELHGGAYLNSVFEIDLNRHTAKRYDYNYLNEVKKGGKEYNATGGKVDISKDKHTERFIENTFKHDKAARKDNAKQFMLFRDYDDDEGGGRGPVVRGEQHYREIVQNQTAYAHHLNATQISVHMKGRLDIQCGQVLNLNARKLNASGDGSEENRQLSGNYLVRSVTHQMVNGILKTDLTLTKYDWNKVRPT